MHILVMASFYIFLLFMAAMGSGAVNAELCSDFISFPESMAVSIGTSVCFTCDYPGSENEVWSTFCASDQDSLCTCSVSDVSPGVRLCFTNFHSDCSGNYYCNASIVETGVMCSAQAQIVATGDLFTEHPVTVTAVSGNNVTFTCGLLNGTGVLWQRNNTDGTTFLNSTTPPGNYILSDPNTLSIVGVQPGNEGMYRCAYEIQQGIFLYSDYGELEYLGEGVTLSLAETPVSLLEGATTMVCITASGTIPESYDIEFSVFSSDETAQSVVDYDRVNITRTLSQIDNPSCVETISITTQADSVVEAEETFLISLSSESFIVTIDNQDLQVTIEDTDILTLGFERTSYSVEEGATLTVCLTAFDGELDGAEIAYNVYTEDGTATVVGVDYDPVNIQDTLSSVPDVNCLGAIDVITNNDTIVENQQYFTIIINSSKLNDSVNITQNFAIIQIEDNDRITIQFDRTNYYFDEDSSFWYYEVLYDTEVEGVSLEYAITRSDQTATSGEDYTSINYTILITDDSSLMRNFTFTVIDDSEVEGNETLFLEMSSNNPRVIVATPTSLVTIVDDDRRVDLFFEQTTYTFSENDNVIVSVCATTADQTVYDFDVPLGVGLSSNSANVTKDVNFTSSSLVLVMGETRVCSEGRINEDRLAEGTEIFYISLSSTQSNIILNHNTGIVRISIQTQVTITDSSVFEVRFESSTYTVSESVGTQTICLEKVDAVDIAPGTIIDINLQEVSDEPLAGVAFDLPSQPVSFDRDSVLVCTVLTVINDTTAQGDRSVLLGVEARLSEFQVLGDITTITFLDEQAGVMCGDLVCRNSGECLDDFLCQCPPEYTGPECEIRLVQQPILEVTASSPQLDSGYEADCILTVDSGINLLEMEGTVELEWLGLDGQPVNMTDVIVGEVTITENNATLSLSISSLNTGHAGQYTCQATLLDEVPPTVLEYSVNITFTLPPPSFVFILQAPSGLLSSGEAVIMSCSSVTPDSVLTPVLAMVEWTVGDGQPIPLLPRYLISPTLNITPSVFISTLTISPVYEEDAGVYSCRTYFVPDGELSEYLQGSSVNSLAALQELIVSDSSLSVSLSTESDRVPGVPPYNTFQLTCESDSPEYLESVSFEIRWIRETGPDQQQIVTSDDDLTTIETSLVDSKPVSVLTVSQATPAQYVFFCEIEYRNGEDLIAYGSSNYSDVTVSGPSNPALPFNVNVYGTGVEFVVVQWRIFRVEYTPETYYVEYAEFSDGETVNGEDIVSVEYPATNDNFTAVSVQFTFIVSGLRAASMHGLKIVAENSVGETRIANYVTFQTREEEPFTNPNDETDFTYPIGAAIDLRFRHNFLPLTDDGGLVINYSFVPGSHTPLQQPQFTTFIQSQTMISAGVEYRFASPSLSGEYVLCNQNEIPRLCGGRISLTITVPTLSISTDLLVSQYVDGEELNGMSPELTCAPSDSRAPVQWSTLPVYVDLEQQYSAQFVPPDLNQTLRFPAVYERLPRGTLRLTCDLINIEEPGVAVDPVDASVIFTQNPVALFNNDREMKPNSVINVFSEFEDTDYLSVGCVGTAGNGNLEWERLSGVTEGFSDSVTIEYYSTDRRITNIIIHPVTEVDAGYYSCRSTDSMNEAIVLITFEDPYFSFTSLSEYEVPLGVTVDLLARYAYSSDGIINIGTGFSYTLTFLAFIPYSNTTSDSDLPTNLTLPTSSIARLQPQVLDAGITDDSSNNYIYTIYAHEYGSGQYNMTFVDTQTQDVYEQATDITVTVPYITDYEAEIVATRTQNVTISCIPNDQRAPVLWNLEVILRQVEEDPLLHNYTQYFIFDPPTLRHRVTFNVSIVSQSFSVNSSALYFNCGFMNGRDDENIFNATSVSVLLQDDVIQLDHAFTNLRIFNNTVINMLGEGEGFTPTQPESKRGSPVLNSLYIDCMASQGDHRPVWTTSNPIVGGSTMVIPVVGLGFGTEALSEYVSRLSFDYFYSAFEGVYSCQSGLSNEFAEIYITQKNPFVISVLPQTVYVVEDDSITLEFKIAANSDGNTWYTEDISFSFQPFFLNDEGYEIAFSVCDSDFPQNYCYTIESVDRSQEGVYLAFASSLSEDEASQQSSIELNVTRRCPVEVNGGIQWPWTLEGTTAFRPCSEAGSMFRVGPRASRQCDQEGEWEDADLTSCTIADVEEPFILVWFVIDADEYTDSMEQDFIDNLVRLLDLNGILYSQVSLKSAYIASVAITFQVDLVEGDQTQNISEFSSFVEDSEIFSSFSGYSVMEGGRGSLDVKVADTCLCSSAGMGSSLQLCSGAAISPCDCMDAVCLCQTPFVGDGMSCTLDSDSDGYPDQPLDSPSCSSDEAPSYCTADVCPEVTNSEQDPVACQPDATTMEVFVGCPYGDDDEWAITWPNTPGGSISTQPCPGGVDTNGTATRVCYENGTWGAPGVLSCQSLEILRILEMANDLLPAADDEIDEVTPELIENAEMVSEQLAIATDTQQEAGLLPLDLNSTNSIVSQVLNVLESSVEEGIGYTPNDELIDVFNNVLNETNEGGWTALQTIGSGSQTLLQNAERYGAYLASAVNNTDEPLMLVRENIIVSAEVVDTSSNVSDVVFPESPSQLDNFALVDVNDTVQITIPGSALTTLTEGKGVSDVSIVHIIFRNLEDFLPANASYLSNSRAESLVISSQLGGLDPTDIPENIFQENPIIFNFSFTTSPDRVIEYLGVFWEFSDPVGSGGWSSEGVKVISNETRGDLTIVQCSSTHLTSFAVLVDVSGGLEDVPKEEKLALQVVSYIGCIISSICLSITVVFYLAMGKKLFSAVHYFVHLNLALTLLLGYVVFMLGIELGTTSIGGCAFVAALLQYLFLSAFCWMMCEGIMLYLMLIVVFSKLSNKWWFFMILGYCTPLLFVVVGLAARADYYGVKDDDGELSFCWLSTEKGTIYAFVAPVLAIVIINTVFLVMALVALGRNMKQKAKSQDKDMYSRQAITILKAAVILLPLPGLTWLFGLLTLNDNATVFAWLFTIFNSLQGAAIFFFHVIRSNKVWSKISPRLRLVKQCAFKPLFKYDVSTSYSGSESQNAMRTLVHKKPLNSSTLSYDSSGQPTSTVGIESFSESELQTATDDFEKKPLDTIPEGGAGKSGDVIITDPCTEIESYTQESREEVTRK